MDSDLFQIAEEGQARGLEGLDDEPENQQFFRKAITKTDTEKSLAGSRQASRSSLFSSSSQTESLKSGESVIRVDQERLSSDVPTDLEDQQNRMATNDEIGSTTNLLTVDSISIGSVSSNNKDLQHEMENSFGVEPVDKVAPDNALEQMYRLSLAPKEVPLGISDHQFRDSDDELLEELAQNSKKAMAAMQSKSKRKKKEEMTKKLMDNQAKLGLKITSAKEMVKEREKKRQIENDQEENDCRCDEIRKDPRLKTKVCVIM